MNACMHAYALFYFIFIYIYIFFLTIVSGNGLEFGWVVGWMDGLRYSQTLRRLFLHIFWLVGCFLFSFDG